MKNVILRIGTLLLALAMIISVTGCGNKYEDEEIEYIYQYEDGASIPEDELNSIENEEVSSGNTESAVSEESEPTESKDTVSTESKDNQSTVSKTESKVESKDESKTESKDESKIESKDESKVESKDESKVESKDESKVESKDESKVESKDESKVESKDESKNESNKTDNSSEKTSSVKRPPSKTETKINDNVNPKDYKNTEITYATWRNPALYEDGPVVEEFEKKYGIKVNVDLINEEDYTNTVLGRIASGKSPDVYFSTYTFPYCIDALQPIDAAKLDLNESIWDKSLINISTVNGKTYLVDTVGSIWKDEDMVFYNKKIFRDNNWTTPEEYYEAGKWTFDTMKKCMQQVASLGTEYTGGAVHLEGLIHSAGASVIGMKNGKFYNGTTDTVTQDIMRWASTGLKEGWLSTTSIYTALNQFPSGKVGIAILHSFGLKKTGYLRNMKATDIGFTYLPSWNGKEYTPTSFVRGWGICKGAKNPVAAGIFLRNYLDVNNYDTNSAFISKEAENFFFKLTSTATSNKNFYFCYGSGVNGVTGKESAVSDYIGKPATSDPTQVVTAISSYQNEINADIAKLNEKLK